jgi:hypothetical protein
MQRRGSTWIVGGVGLIACGISGVIRDSLPGIHGAGETLSILTGLLWAGSILILGIGFRREDSLVVRKPLGLASMVTVALWPLITTTVGLVAPLQDSNRVTGWSVWTYVSLIVPLAAALIATVQIARSGAVPAPWNWAPMWLAAGQTVLWVATSVTGPNAFMYLAGVYSALGSLCFLAATIGLGVLAIVLTSRRTRTTDVFRSTTPE